MSQASLTLNNNFPRLFNVACQTRSNIFIVRVILGSIGPLTVGEYRPISFRAKPYWVYSGEPYKVYMGSLNPPRAFGLHLVKL